MPETKRPLKVFLCHAHSDAAVVRGLYSRLKREGVDVWLDKEKLLPGADWELEIRKAVREVDVVVVCLSKQFNQAGFRQKEVRIALDTALEKPEGEIFIIPARLEECETLESLSKWHWVDLFDADGYHKLIWALRARSDKIGATLRIRARRRSASSESKSSESDNQYERSSYKANINDLTGTVSAENQILEENSQKSDELEKEEGVAKERLEVEAAERARKDKAEREVAEKTTRENTEKARREQVEGRAVQVAALKESFSNSRNKSWSTISKAMPLLGFVGILAILIWVASWALPQLVSKTPTVLPSSTTAGVPSHTAEPTIPPEVMAGIWQNSTGIEYTVVWKNNGYEVTLIAHPVLGNIEVWSQTWQNGILVWQYRLAPNGFESAFRIRTNYLDADKLHVSVQTLGGQNPSSPVEWVLTRIR